MGQRNPAAIRVSFLVGLVSLGLAGCTYPESAALPTLRPLAAVPALPELRDLPATYTPIPSPERAPEFSRGDGPVPTLAATTIAPPTVVTLAPEATPVTSNPAPVAWTGDRPPLRTACDGTGLLYRGQFPSQVGGPWRTYRAYIPPCYGEDGRSYPVLYLFHGSIQTDSHWTDLGLAGYMDANIGSGRYPPFIVIMPYNGELGNKTSGNANSIEGITVDALIPYVESVFCAWQSRAGRGIGGISRGGYWALMIAFRHEGMFSAVAGHSSHLRFETDAAAYNPLATYAEADLSGMRIWLDWGEEDFLAPGQQQLHESLAAAGIDHAAAVNPGGHSDGYWRAHLQEYLDWHTWGWPRDRSVYPACDL